MSDDKESYKDSEKSSDEGKEAKEKGYVPISRKNTLPKKYIKTQKVTNAPNLISQSEPPAPKGIMVGKMRTGLSVLYGVTGSIVMPENAFQ